MAEYNITDDLQQINFGATGTAEILQNIRMILSTVAFSCPMDRDFAWNPSGLDGPINIIQAKTTARIVAAIRKYEPRAEVVKVSYQGDGLKGMLKPMVGVRIKDDAV